MVRRLTATGIAGAIAVVAMLIPGPAAADTGSDMLERARSWTEANVGYSGSNYFTNQYGTYRTDCSGYVSMIWGLPTSLTTVTLPSVSLPIAKDALEPGDVLNNPLPGTSGHVVLFAGWADAAQTQYYGYEETPSGGAHLSQIPYPYWPGYGTFSPRRYLGLTTATPTPPPVKIDSITPDREVPLVDGDFVRYEGRVYRIAGGAPIAVTSWQDVGGREQARKLNNDEFAALAVQPEDGTFLRTYGTKETYVVVGGAPVFVPRGTLDVKDAVTVDPAAVDEAGANSSLNDTPADGTMVRTDRGERYVFAGGAPIHVTDEWFAALRPKPKAVTVAQEAIDLAGGFRAWSHVRAYPADGTWLKVEAEVYQVTSGVPVPGVGVRGVPVDPAAIANAGGEGPWSHLQAP